MKKTIITILLALLLLAALPAVQSRGTSFEAEDDDPEPPLFSHFGIIHGTTYINQGWRLIPRPFIFIKAESEHIKRVTISGPFAHYRLILPIDHDYTITAGGCLSKTITLSTDDPYTQLDFQF